MVLCSDPNSGFQGAEKTGSDVSDQPRNPLARKHPVGAPLRSPHEAGAQAGREPAPARFGGLFPYDSESQTLEFSPCLKESGPAVSARCDLGVATPRPEHGLCPCDISDTALPVKPSVPLPVQSPGG